MSATTLSERKDVVRRANEREWLAGEFDETLYADGYVMHDPMGDHEWPAVREMVEAVRAGTPDLEFRFDDVLGEGDQVVVRYTLSGTNTGPSFLTAEPTGEHWEGSGISIYRFEDGKIAEQWDTFDYLGVMQQLGLLPEASPAASP